MTLASTEIDLRLTAALAIIRSAGSYAHQRFSDPHGMAVTLKHEQDWLTDVDGKVESLIRGQITNLFAHDAVLGEEEGGKIAPVTWIIDPIDGTVNFLRGQPLWCISLALVVSGRVEFGIVYAPVLAELFYASRSGAAWLNNTEIKANTTISRTAAKLEFGSTRARGADNYFRGIGQIMQHGAEHQRLGTGALSLAWVACGRLDGYAELGMHIWDGIAGWVIARQAGASVNDYDQQAIANSNGTIICAGNADLAALLQTSIAAAAGE